MNKMQWFKNFPMVCELDIAGTFIYRGIREFNRITSLESLTEVFMTLYDIAVGIERLQKILIILLEDIEECSIKDFEQSLITHSHSGLHDRIKRNSSISFLSRENALLQLLTSFYETCRYDRFCYDSESLDKEKTLFIEFLKKHAEFVDNSTNDILPATLGSKEKEIFGRIVGCISVKYYKEIFRRASELNLFTYELNAFSPAARIFWTNSEKQSLQKEYDKEVIALKELIVYLVNTNERHRLLDLIKEIQPLDFDIALVNDWLNELLKGNVSPDLVNSVDCLYEDYSQTHSQSLKERIEWLELIGNSDVLFDYEEDDDTLEMENEEMITENE